MSFYEPLFYQAQVDLVGAGSRCALLRCKSCRFTPLLLLC